MALLKIITQLIHLSNLPLKDKMKIFLKKNTLTLINTTYKFLKTTNFKEIRTLGPEEKMIIDREENKIDNEDNNTGLQEDRSIENNINHQKGINLPEMKQIIPYKFQS
jgi:hypothetical protein